MDPAVGSLRSPETALRPPKELTAESHPCPSFFPFSHVVGSVDSSTETDKCLFHTFEIGQCTKSRHEPIRRLSPRSPNPNR